MSIMYTGDDESREKHLEISLRSDALLKRLMEEKNAFVVDTYNYQPIDESGTPLFETNDLDGLPVEISPYGHCIRVSTTYLRYNPIQILDGSLDEKIVYDDKILNIMVPEQYRSEESDIIEAYKKLFYFEKIEVANIYNETLSIQLDKTETDDLGINIIYVSDGQSYFTFNADICPETNNRITDPIVVIYTQNIHPSYAHSFMTHCVIFQSNSKDTQGAYKEIEPIISDCAATDSYKKVYSVYEENCK